MSETDALRDEIRRLAGERNDAEIRAAKSHEDLAAALRERDALRTRLESAETTISKQAAKIPASIIAIQALSPGEARDLLAEIGGMLRAALGAASEEQDNG